MPAMMSNVLLKMEPMPTTTIQMAIIWLKAKWLTWLVMLRIKELDLSQQLTVLVTWMPSSTPWKNWVLKSLTLTTLVKNQHVRLTLTTKRLLLLQKPWLISMQLTLRASLKSLTSVWMNMLTMLRMPKGGAFFKPINGIQKMDSQTRGMINSSPTLTI